MNAQQLLELLEKNRQSGRCVDGYPCVCYQGTRGAYCDFGLRDIDRPAYAPLICPLQYILTKRHNKILEQIKQKVAEYEASLTQQEKEGNNASS